MTDKLTKILLATSAVLSLGAFQAKAADVVVAEPEPVEYVRVCDAYGAGYFYIPGTDTCMQLGGFVAAMLIGGEDVYSVGIDASDMDTFATLARATVNLSTATETDLGSLRTFMQLRSDFISGSDIVTGQIRFAYIDLGGLRIGIDESAFLDFAGHYGSFVYDDVIAAGIYRTNLIKYNWANDNGLSAVLSLEQGGDNGYFALTLGDDFNTIIDDYMPHVVAGLKLQQGWGSIVGLVGYDSLLEEVTGKVRLDVNVTDTISLWAMGAVTSADNGELGIYNTFRGDYGLWAGASFGLTDTTIANIQLAMDDENEYVAANLNINLTPDLILMPEINYLSHDVVDGKDLDGFGALVYLQRTF